MVNVHAVAEGGRLAVAEGGDAAGDGAVVDDAVGHHVRARQQIDAAAALALPIAEPPAEAKAWEQAYLPRLLRYRQSN